MCVIDKYEIIINNIIKIFKIERKKTLAGVSKLTHV